MSEANQQLAGKYDAVAYAAQSNALSHPAHLGTVARLHGLAAARMATCRVLEVGCNDGANLLPMAAAWPDARFVGCDLSGAAIASAKAAAAALGLSNIEFEQRDLSTYADDPEPFDYIIAHGVYSWVPVPVREALFALAARRLAGNGVLFVSYNTFPGCRVRQAVWDVLHHHVDQLPEPRQRLDAARALASLLAAPGSTQTDTDALLRHEFARVAAEDDSALFHDDLSSPNDPVYFHQFAAQLASHGLAYLAEAKLSMMTTAGLSPPMQQFLAGMAPLQREQYLDFARFRRFRQSLACRADATADKLDTEQRIAGMHVVPTMALMRAAAEGKAFSADISYANVNLRAARRMLQWLVGEAPRIVAVAEARAWMREHATDTVGAASIEMLLADACFAGIVDLLVDPPVLASLATARPVASPVARWQAAQGRRVTNLRHETMRIADPQALAQLATLDGTRSHDDLARALAQQTPGLSRAAAAERVGAMLHEFALHALLVG